MKPEPNRKELCKDHFFQLALVQGTYGHIIF